MLRHLKPALSTCCRWFAIWFMARPSVLGFKNIELVCGVWSVSKHLLVAHFKTAATWCTRCSRWKIRLSFTAADGVDVVISALSLTFGSYFALYSGMDVTLLLLIFFWAISPRVEHVSTLNYSALHMALERISFCLSSYIVSIRSPVIY